MAYTPPPLRIATGRTPVVVLSTITTASTGDAFTKRSLQGVNTSVLSRKVLLMNLHRVVL